jgi:uncharacterized phage protein (TIGR01671 family)
VPVVVIMREIKFRYTVKRENGYVFSRIFSLEEIERGEVIIWANANIVDLKKAVRKQFTGLRDKNGREIYEGDVVSCDEIHIHDMSDPDPFKRRIGWHDDTGSFGFFMMDGRPHASGYTYCKNNLETIFYVIGTIHENPELLP